MRNSHTCGRGARILALTRLTLIGKPRFLVFTCFSAISYLLGSPYRCFLVGSYSDPNFTHNLAKTTCICFTGGSGRICFKMVVQVGAETESYEILCPEPPRRSHSSTPLLRRREHIPIVL